MIFADLELDWNGATYRLTGDGKTMKALAAVEEHITLADLIAAQQTGRAPFAKLSMAYATLLRHAGAVTVSDADVYRAMWDDGKTAAAVQEAVAVLLSLMVPPDVFARAAEPEKAIKKKGSPRPSKPPTKRR